MSLARAQLLADINGIRQALALDSIASGASAIQEPPAVVVLRRGLCIAALIALETFVRNRTNELLGTLANWPARFEDLPQKFRDAALLESLNYIQKYAHVLKRQNDDYETEITGQVRLMGQSTGPQFGFTKFIAGDFTGNISQASLKSLLSVFSIPDCWNAFHRLSSSIGFGAPSVQALLDDLVRARHRSAHASGYSPTAAEILALPTTLTCLGLCIDAALTGSVGRALSEWREWTDGSADWRAALDVLVLDPHGTRFRLQRHGSTRALRIVDAPEDARLFMGNPPRGRVTLIAVRDNTSVPQSWIIAA